MFVGTRVVSTVGRNDIVRTIVAILYALHVGRQLVGGRRSTVEVRIGTVGHIRGVNRQRADRRSGADRVEVERDPTKTGDRPAQAAADGDSGIDRYARSESERSRPCALKCSGRYGSSGQSGE